MRLKPDINKLKGVVIVTLVALLYAGVPLASVYASSVSQSFRADVSDIVEGAIVSLKQTGGDSVVLATLANRPRLVGVAGNSALLELGTEASLKIVLQGAAVVLVSDFNGRVKAGDRITASPLAGIGMKATESVMVVGTAQADMDVSRAEDRTVTGANGKKRAVKVGSVPLLVAPVFYDAAVGKSTVRSQLQVFANNLAGHNVSPVRVLVAGIVVVVLVGAIMVLLYTAVRFSITAVGRNPLSRRMVYKSLFEVGVAALGVSAFAVIMVYLILTT